MKHPDKQLLERYAWGNLDITLRLLVECHLEFCPGCEEQVSLKRQQVLEPALAEASSESDSLPINLPASAFDNILGQIQNTPAPLSSSPGEIAHIPRPLRPDIYEEAKWEWTSMWPSKGRIGAVLNDPSTGYSLYLAYFKAGEQTPKHKHLDNEYTVMLEGGYQYGDTKIHVGDWDVARKDTTHSPTVFPTGDCWCMVRSKTRGSVEFKGTAAWRKPFIFIFNLIDKWKGSVD